MAISDVHWFWLIREDVEEEGSYHIKGDGIFEYLLNSCKGRTIFTLIDMCQIFADEELYVL